jgi:hypothetical protein
MAELAGFGTANRDRRDNAAANFRIGRDRLTSRASEV